MVQIRKTGGDGSPEAKKQDNPNPEEKPAGARARGATSRRRTATAESAGGPLESAGASLRETGEELRQGEQSLPEARRQWEELKGAADQAERQLQALRAQSAQALGELDQAGQEAERVRAQSQQALDAFRQTGEFLAAARKDSETVWQQFHDTQKQLQTVRTQSDQARAQLGEAREAVQDAERALAAAREQSLQARQELEQAAQNLEEARRQSHEAQEEFFGIREEVEAAAQELTEVRRQLDQARRAAQEARGGSGPARTEAPQARLEPEHVLAVASPPGHESAAEPVVFAVARDESPHDRLARYLNDAWAVEKALVKTLQDMAGEVIDPTLRGLLERHREVTQRQQQALEERLRALGSGPTGGKGFFAHVLGRLWDALHAPKDDLDRLLQDLLKGFATEQFEIAMYESLQAYARAVGDTETAELAARHLREEQEAAAQLWPLIAPTAVQIAVGPETSPAATG